ncbi:ABC transporter substrate-binding protein [Methylobacterium pseudosasicola]|uniref:Peptide/nickel transport system substrate-binding protein n=1 Tax=Methylobacterium pseudosasicola TaxID=582667 RepID=A0A1I4Q7I2_9HYPH|nr:ABC transporter substrate-binding protein [Methylobacterium pseudosasicola]SFM35590.1 peptide/nickel transport system substrate-binding protein [Methylobacterium pseudosasicola]
MTNLRDDASPPAPGRPLRRPAILGRLGMLAAAAVCLLGAAARDCRADGPVPGGTLTVGLASDTAIIDPSITGSSITALITRHVVDSLVGQAEDKSFTPWLAERWEVNADNTVYTFHLRRGVTFSDGTRLDAEAVTFNINRILDPKTTSSYAKSLLGPLDTVTAPDPDTVVFRYTQPFVPLLQGLSLPYLGIQSPTYLRDARSTTNTVVGSGPFILERYVKGSGSHLVRRKDYAWGPGFAAHTGPAYLDAIAFRYLPEAAVRLGALTSGQIQAIDEVPPANFRAVQADPRLRVVTRENPGVNWSLFLNTSRGPFADIRVRQAFQSAIDIPALVKVAFFGSLKPADNILGPATLHYDPAVARSWGFDPQRAARLLDEAGWTRTGPEGIRTKAGARLAIRLVYDTAFWGADNLTLVQAVQYAVKKAGFDLQLDPVDAGGFTARTAANDYDSASIYYVRPEPDILRTVFHSAYIPPNGANFSRVTALDAALTQAVGAPDAVRGGLYRQIQAEIIGSAYAVPLYVPAFQLGASKRLNGISWTANAKPSFYDAWLAP